MKWADLSEPRLRALSSFVAVVAGTAFSCALGANFGATALAAAGAAGLASLFRNILVADLGRVWDGRRRQPAYIHTNNDLTQLNGDAVATVLARCAKDRNTDADWFRSLYCQSDSFNAQQIN